MSVCGDPARVRNAMLMASACAWALILAGSSSLFPHCAAVTSGSLPFGASFRMQMAMNSPGALAAGWSLMLVAMMSPTVIAPVIHVRFQSFRRRRARATALLLASYSVVWMAAGLGLLAIDFTLNSLAPGSWGSAGAAAIGAIVWQCSPLKQRCLNRCHLHREVRAFGSAADFDAIRFGLRHGLWCVGSCWAAMLAAMIAPRGHLIAMAIVTVLMFSERLDGPAPLAWRWRGLGRLTRIAMTRMRIRLGELGFA